MSTRRSLSTFRLHLVLTTTGVAVTFALVIAAAIFAPLVSQLDRGDLDRAALAGVADTILRLHTSYWPVVAVILAATVASALLLFRRMTSPLVRFVRVFEALSRGETPTAVRIRRVDYLHREAECLNRMLSALGERATARERACVRIEEALAEIEACALEPKAAAAVEQGREGLRALRGDGSG